VSQPRALTTQVAALTDREPQTVLKTIRAFTRPIVTRHAYHPGRSRSCGSEGAGRALAHPMRWSAEDYHGHSRTTPQASRQQYRSTERLAYAHPLRAARGRQGGERGGQGGKEQEKEDEQTPTPGAAPGLRPPRRRSGRKTSGLECPAASRRAVEDQCRSAATAAKPLDNPGREWTAAECRPSAQTAMDGPGRLASAYGSDGPSPVDEATSDSVSSSLTGRCGDLHIDRG